MGRRMVSISGELFTEMITEGWQAGGPNEVVRCIEGLPKGAQFVARGTEQLHSSVEPKEFLVWLMYEHPEWPDVKPYPWQSVVFERAEAE